MTQYSLSSTFEASFGAHALVMWVGFSKSFGKAWDYFPQGPKELSMIFDDIYVYNRTLASRFAISLTFLSSAFCSPKNVAIWIIWL